MLTLRDLYILLLSFLLCSCGADHDDFNLISEELNKKNLKQEVTEILTSPEKIDFSHVKKLILDVSCVDCHSANKKIEGRVSLESYEGIFGKTSFRKIVIPFNPDRSALYNSLIVESGALHMPPKHRSQLSEEQKNLVFQWISGGAKLKSAEQPIRPKSLKEQLQPYFAEPQKIDYQLVDKLIFSKSCFKCHSSKSKDAVSDAILYGQDMTSYAKLFENNGVVKNRIVDKVLSDGNGKLKKIKGSRIYKSIASHQTMPPSKEGYDPVGGLSVKVLRLWILNCAIESYEKIKDDDNLLPPLDEDEERTEGKVRDCF